MKKFVSVLLALLFMLSMAVPTVAESTTVTVTFNVNQGIAIAPLQLPQGSIRALDDAVRAGYAFGGWYVDKQLKIPHDATKPLIQSVTLYAKWLKLYTVKFSLNGAKGDAPASQSVKSGGLVQKPDDPSLTNAAFVGWYKDKAGKKAWNFATSKIKADTTLYAKVKQVKVTFKLNGGSGKAPAKQTLKPGARVTQPTSPTRKGYTFTAWCKDAKGKTAWDFETGAAEKNMTLYAGWKKNASTPGATKPPSGSTKLCPTCRGKGYSTCTACNGKGMSTCYRCGGRGFYYGPMGMMMSCQMYTYCMRCDNGRVTCPTCNGTGAQ